MTTHDPDTPERDSLTPVAVGLLIACIACLAITWHALIALDAAQAALSTCQSQQQD